MRLPLRELAAVTGELAERGANLTVVVPGLDPIAVGHRPGAATASFRSAAALAPLARRDLLGLAEGYLRGEIDLAGDFGEIMKLTDVFAPDPGWRERLSLAVRLLLRSRRRLQRESVAFHYDRPPEFFLPWFERWRSYSHGFYATPHDDPEEAQARKLQYAIDALGLKPGDEVFDMGCGWGSFLEFAGLQGIRVHGITISEAQHAFVQELIREKRLPCRVERVDFLDYRPGGRFDGAVFMGTFEHFADHRYAMRFLARHLKPDARFYTDFCTERGSRQVGAFLARHVWPGTARYVDLPGLLVEITRAGFNVHELRDDTTSYACTCRDWADALEAGQHELAEAFGQEPVRAFLLFLRASEHYLFANKTQAYHLVAGRRPASTSATVATQATPKRSPTRP